ncbi:MAG: SDR family oxidoreductase [Chloroflexota bacterium]|nr:SDR family oxidoreductase [Chloroflexota bacterium]
MQRLAGQVAIVTGGAMGIGGATAVRLAEEGAKVLIADVNQEAAARKADEIRSAGGTVETIRADTGSHDNIRAMIGRADELWGGLHILVNNAYSPTESGAESGSALDVSEEAWDRGMAVLVKAMFLGAKYAVPLIERSGGGSIVNLSSVHGLLMAPKKLVYEAGKTAVIGLTRQMACDFGPLGIRVNAICPGHIVTERLQERWNQNPSGLKFFEAQYPVRRTGKPVDIANAIVFLCSDEASFITGHALVVDGGLSIQLQEDLGCNLAGYYRDHPETEIPYTTAEYE